MMEEEEMEEKRKQKEKAERKRREQEEALEESRRRAAEQEEAEQKERAWLINKERRIGLKEYLRRSKETHLTLTTSNIRYLQPDIDPYDLVETMNLISDANWWVENYYEEGNEVFFELKKWEPEAGKKDFLLTVSEELLERLKQRLTKDDEFRTRFELCGSRDEDAIAHLFHNDSREGDFVWVRKYEP